MGKHNRSKKSVSNSPDGDGSVKIVPPSETPALLLPSVSRWVTARAVTIAAHMNLLSWIKKDAFRLGLWCVWVSGHIFSFSYLETFSGWHLRFGVFICGFFFFFPLHVNLPWVSLLQERAEPLQGIFGLATIHPETLGTSQAHVRISCAAMHCKSNLSGKGCALHNCLRSGSGDPTSFQRAWKRLLQALLPCYLVPQKCRVIVTEKLVLHSGQFFFNESNLQIWKMFWF